MAHQLLLDVIEALEDSGSIAIIVLPYGAEEETPEEEKEETPYDEFREAELFEMGAGVDQDAILMDNPLQS
jgi:hypothetical protein